MSATSVRFPVLMTEIEGVPVGELARQYGTPLFVYDAAGIRRQIDRLRRFDVIRYAQKANSNLTLLRIMREAGVLVDAVSAGEIARALAAGYPATGSPEPIVYTADIFDRESLDRVVDLGIHPNMGSIDMIHQFGKRAAGRPITLRINPGFGHGHSQKTNTGGPQSKHGIWHEELETALEIAQRFDLPVVGLHMHIGSGTDLEHLAQVADAMIRMAVRAADHLATISAGGGLPTPYRDEDQELDVDRYFQIWDRARKEIEGQLGRPIRLEVEPGRYLVAQHGWLISEIRAVKKMGDNQFYLVDAGFNNLARPIMYGAWHPMAVSPDETRASLDASTENTTAQESIGSHPDVPIAASPKDLRPVVVGGPLCESGDVFTQTEGGYVQPRMLPPAQVGDWLVIGCAGAYGAVMGSNYNSKPLAAEVLLDGPKTRLIRRRQGVRDIFRDEIV